MCAICLLEILHLHVLTSDPDFLQYGQDVVKTLLQTLLEGPAGKAYAAKDAAQMQLLLRQRFTLLKDLNTDLLSLCHLRKQAMNVLDGAIQGRTSKVRWIDSCIWQLCVVADVWC